MKIPRIFKETGINGYTGGIETKKKFHEESATFLRALGRSIGMRKADYDLRSNEGGPAVSGEITLHSDDIYIQIFDGVSFGKGVTLMYRSCTSRTDYTGGANNFIALGRVRTEEDKAKMISAISSLLQKSKEINSRN